jgi:hypothetical protein
MKIASHSTGMLVNDIAVAHHLNRLGCIEAAIDALGGGLKRLGYYEDQLPEYIHEAKTALWRAYRAEKQREPKPMPAVHDED